MEERLFTPLGMYSAGFGAPSTPNEVDQPWGHWRDAGTSSWTIGQFADSPALGPAGTVHVSIADWAKFIQLWFPNSEPRIIDRDTLNELITPRSGDYAAGWEVFSWGGDIGIGHSGGGDFSLSRLWVAPNRGRAYVAVANSADDDTSDLINSILQSLIAHSP